MYMSAMNIDIMTKNSDNVHVDKSNRNLPRAVSNAVLCNVLDL